MGEPFSYIGKREAWGGESAPFGLTQADRRGHLYLLGTSGCGKSTVLRNLVAQDIDAGLGVAVLDPHGELAEELLSVIPPWRTEDVAYFNPADREFPVGLNVLRAFAPEQSHLVASGVVSAFKSIWADSWGPRLEYILFAAVAALAQCENTTLLGVGRMLTDERYRQSIVRQIKDPMLARFWTREFASYDNKWKGEAVSPILNKVGQLFFSPHVRNILGQVESTIDLRFMMDNRRIFIANLSKGKIGEDKSRLLGALLVSQFHLAALARADSAESERRDFNLCVDEFQSFATDSFANILSEARKYRLCLTLSHQFISQLPQALRDAVLGNVAAIIAFRVGSADANILEQEFGSEYPAREFTGLGYHEVLVKMLVNGRYQLPFRGRTLKPIPVDYGRKETIIRRSREKYGRRRILIEGKIERWLR